MSLPLLDRVPPSVELISASSVRPELLLGAGAAFVSADVGMEQIERLLKLWPELPVIVVGAAADAVDFLARGATDHVTPGAVTAETLVATATRAIARQEGQQHIRTDARGMLRRYEVMQALFSIISKREETFEQQIARILEAGCDLFGERIGILSRIEGHAYTVEQVYAPGVDIQPGQTFDLPCTFCEITLDADGPLGIADVLRSPYQTHPCYPATGLRSYIGVPILVDGRPYGTVNFSSPDPLPSPFHDIDLEMVGVLGEWVGAVQTRLQYTRDLEKMANHDRLTGLLNRAAFCVRLEGRLGRMTTPTQPTFSVLFIDLDGFKPINDGLGHLVGDRVLQVVATRLEDALRSADRAGRYGGDEFVLLLDGADRACAERIGARVQQNLSTPIEIQEHTVRIGCSFGVAEYTAGTTAKSMLRQADEDMYRMKRERKLAKSA